MAIHLSFIIYCLLFCTATCAGLVDSIAGSGGLISLPVLLGVGLPPAVALGTNRFQSAIGELTAGYHYFKSGELKLNMLIWPIIFTLIGSSIGTILVQRIHSDLLRQLLPILLLVIVIYTVFSKKFMKSAHKYILSLPVFSVIFGLLIGFYNGFFGPGTGSFWALAFVIFLGFTFRHAAMYAKPVNFFGNMASLFWFSQQMQVDWLASSVMALGQLAGASLGSKLVLKKGDRIVRPIFLTIVILMCVELILKTPIVANYL